VVRNQDSSWYYRRKRSQPTLSGVLPGFLFFLLILLYMALGSNSQILIIFFTILLNSSYLLMVIASNLKVCDRVGI
jgi:hypothetical protein